MSGALRNRSLAEVLIEGGLCTAEQVQRAREREGLDLVSALVAEGVLIEDRAVRSLSGLLGLEVVALEGLQVHERVLSLIPAELAQRYLALPIAMKRSGETDFLYLSLADPLDPNARAELQKAAGCQLVLVLSAPSQLRAAVERFYGARPKRAKVSARIPASLPSESPPPLPRRDGPFGSELRTEPPPARTAARAASSPSLAAHLRSGEHWEVQSEAPKQVHLYDHVTGDIIASEGKVEASRPGAGRIVSAPPSSASATATDARLVDPRDDLRDAILKSGEHPQVLVAPPALGPATERTAGAASKSGLSAPSAPPPKLPAFRLENLPSLPGQGELAARFSPVSVMTEPTARLSVPDLPQPMPTVKDGDFAATILDMPLVHALELPEASEADIDIEETTAEENEAPPPPAEVVMRALEVPVRVSDAPSPFDDLKNVRHRPGLEKTGVIPLAEILRDEFNPRQLEAAPPSTLLGHDDIPQSEDEARARAVPLLSVTPPELPPTPVKRSSAPPPGAPRAVAPPAEVLSTGPALGLVAPLLVAPAPGASPSIENDPTRRVPKVTRRAEPPRADSQPLFQSLLETEPEPTDRRSAPGAGAAVRTPAVAPSPSAPDAANYEEVLVQRLLAGESLAAADRARLVLAIGRLLLERGLISRQELVAILRDAR